MELLKSTLELKKGGTGKDWGGGNSGDYKEEGPVASFRADVMHLKA